MKRYLLLIFCFQLGFLFSQEQEDREQIIAEAKQFIATGNEVLTKDGNFPKAEGEYRKAINKNPIDPTAKYNLANAYYNSEKYDEANQRYTEAAKVATSKQNKHKAFHNQGNTYMEQKKYKEAVEAYKNALRNNPRDEETRYNLALAKKMLEQEQQQSDQNKDDQGGGDQDQDQDQNQDQKEGDDKEEKKGDEGDQKEQDQKDGEDENKGDQGDDKEDKGDEEKDDKGEPNEDKGDQGKDPKEGKPQDQKPQQVQGQLSPQQVKSLLEAMNNEEKKVQDKINAKKVQGTKVKTDKDW